MEDVNRFIRQFGRVPEARRKECLQRALNLIPDGNVMLLVGILMDKSQDRELVELVYNDVLNRDESVKKPISQGDIQRQDPPLLGRYGVDTGCHRGDSGRKMTVRRTMLVVLENMSGTRRRPEVLWTSNKQAIRKPPVGRRQTTHRRVYGQFGRGCARRPETSRLRRS